jgi:hypothetical protein
LSQTAAAGLPPGSRPHVLTLQEAYALALIQNSSSGPIPALRDAVAWDAKVVGDVSAQARAQDFARFRQVFFTSRSSRERPFVDPAPGYLSLLSLWRQVQSDSLTVSRVQFALTGYRELSAGHGSGITQFDIDRIELIEAKYRRTLRSSLVQFQNALDDYKAQLGLGPRVPIVLDDAVFAAFQDGFSRIADWFGDSQRTRTTLDPILNKLPALDDLTFDTHSVIAAAEHPENLAALFGAAERLAAQSARTNPSDRAGIPDSRGWRKTIRALLEAVAGYEAERAVLRVQIRQTDNFARMIFAPPGAEPLTLDSGLESMMRSSAEILSTESRLVSLWVRFATLRLDLYRALGWLPFDDWESYLRQFAPKPGKAQAGRDKAQAPAKLAPSA